MSTPEPIRVFWQPGCSSCLAAKEFLKSREVPFESVNVLASDDAMAELAALGVRTVPVVARGSDYVLAQDLDELAHFVGVVFERDRLTPAQMVERLHLLLDADERFVMALPQDALGTALRGREDRTGCPWPITSR
ncbi:MAG: glutaredoxin [Gammaproteobacteria bacterium]|nr:glutaredoxin [Gammaproteobacteria bacterium]